MFLFSCEVKIQSWSKEKNGRKNKQISNADNKKKIKTCTITNTVTSISLALALNINCPPGWRLKNIYEISGTFSPSSYTTELEVLRNFSIYI